MVIIESGRLTGSHEISSEADSPATDDDLNFEEFSRQPEYEEVNRGLIEKLVSRLPADFCHVDVATGTGLVPRLIIEKAGDKKGRVIGIDPNAISLDIARRRVQSLGGIVVEFIEGYGQNLKQLLEEKIPPVRPEEVDGASILDALHEIRKKDDKVEVIRAMADILKPGGLLAFNSAFTTKGIDQDPRSWGKLKLWAMALLEGRRNKLIQGLPILKPEEYRGMIENAGLKVVYKAEKIVNLTKASLVAISKYPAFINGVFEDMLGQEKFSIRQKSDALIQAIEELIVVDSTLPRVWYEIIAQKPPLLSGNVPIFTHL